MIKKIFLFLVILGLSLGEAYAIEVKKGVFEEKINDISYEKVVDYGPSGIYTREDMLKRLGLTVYDEDKVSFFPEPSFGLGSKVEIARALTVVLNDGGEIKTYRTWKKTIGEFLEEIKLDLGKDDVVSLSNDQILKKDIEINITRVAITEVKEYEDIDYDVIYKNDPELERGLEQIIQSPSFGQKELTYLVKRENGKEVSRDLINSEITKEPVDKIVSKGTKVTVLGRGKASWYDWISGMTAAHNTLPMGSKVLVRAVNSGKEVVVTIVDRGIQTGAVIDLSADAFGLLAPHGAGIIDVVLEKP